MPEVHTMNAGDGEYSYNKNSHLQRKVTSKAEVITDEVILQKLDVKALLSSSNSILLADLGCSTGPNTFICIQNLINTIKQKLRSQGIISNPHFQVFFNDHTANDFNTLFTSLPSDKQYFAAGVPGSFHGRLFPNSSLHVVHSAFAIQWLSQAPQVILDETSSAYNKGRIHYASAPKEVHEAYADQFVKDMAVFFSARAQEIVPGGIMVLLTLDHPDGVSYSSTAVGVMFDLLGYCLIDMAKEGLITEAQVDSFNVPVYAPSVEEMRKLIENNGCFDIEKLDVLATATAKVDGHTTVSHIRAGFEGMFSKHFGSHVIDELFERYLKKTEHFSSRQQESRKHSSLLIAVLKRK